MLRGLKLLLPALIPSWNFFDVIAPSPRIEFTTLRTPQDQAEDWREFRPRPADMPFAVMLKRLLWNPVWNESLFLVSCAERLMDNPTEHSRQEIFKRIATETLHQQIKAEPASYLKFRLVFVRRRGDVLEKEITYVSEARKLTGATAP